MVIGQVRGDLRYEFTPVGGVVNLAARIKFAAHPMSVLVSENTYRFVAPVFECVDLGLIEVKDRPEPVRVYQVCESSVEPGKLRGLAGLESPMVGREAELAALYQLCEAVRAGLGRAALITGEPGIGKTRLINVPANPILGERSLTVLWKRVGLSPHFGSTLLAHRCIRVCQRT